MVRYIRDGTAANTANQSEQTHRNLKTKKSNMFLHANVTIAGLSKLLPELAGTHGTLKLPRVAPNYPDFLVSDKIIIYHPPLGPGTPSNWRQLARYCHLFHLGLHEKAWPTHRRREHRLTAMASCSQPFLESSPWASSFNQLCIWSRISTVHLPTVFCDSSNMIHPWRQQEWSQSEK